MQDFSHLQARKAISLNINNFYYMAFFLSFFSQQKLNFDTETDTDTDPLIFPLKSEIGK